MTRKSLHDYNCSIARTLDIIGDQWSLLILRDAFVGLQTFSQFQKSLGVSRNILSQRLANLVDNEILVKTPVSESGKRNRYSLSERGLELLPALIALLQWGDKWIFGSQGEPVRVLDVEHRAPIQKIGVISREGQYLEPHQILFRPGPASIRGRGETQRRR